MSEINNYINQSRGQGLTDEQIRQELLKTGWTNEQAGTALGANSMLNNQIDINLIKKGQRIGRYGTLVLGAMVVIYVFWLISASVDTGSKASQDLAFNLFFGGLAYGVPLLVLAQLVFTLVSGQMILKGSCSSKFLLFLPIFALICLFLGVWLALDKFEFDPIGTYFLWGGIILFAIINMVYGRIISFKIKKYIF
jgi:hypothetical protein